MKDMLRDKIESFPKAPGVYLFKDEKGRVLYIGKAKSLRDRVSSYLGGPAPSPKIAAMVQAAVDVECLPTDSEVDALLLENRLIKDLQPRYNTALRDDKSYPYLAISTKDDFAAVSVTRETDREGYEFIGPFTAASDLRSAIAVLQRIFKFRTCEMEIREDDARLKHFRPCLLYHIDRCTAPCNLRVSRAEYASSIQAFRRVLAGRKKGLLAEWTKAMKKAAKALDFERAAVFRDRVKALEALDNKGAAGDFLGPPSLKLDPAVTVECLGEALCEGEPPRIIEGLDIAHLGGAETVASLVTFVDGLPFKAGYRRFRIREVQGVDDYASLREVVRRRLKRVRRGEEVLPDLLVVDGGKGQLGAVLATFEACGVAPPRLCSLAKREEEVFLPGRASPLVLDRSSAALKLLQQVRDEAHRFAQHYHHLLRSKAHFDGQPPARGRRSGRRSARDAKPGAAGEQKGV